MTTPDFDKLAAEIQEDIQRQCAETFGACWCGRHYLTHQVEINQDRINAAVAAALREMYVCGQEEMKQRYEKVFPILRED